MQRITQLLTAFVLLTLTVAVTADTRLTPSRGFVLETLPFSVPNARQMALTANGTLIVGTRKAGKVYAVLNPFTDSARVITLVKGLNMPSGVAILGSDLYIAAVSTG